MMTAALCCSRDMAASDWKRWLRIDAHAFNGEYYVQPLDLADPRYPVDGELGQIKYQIGSGCHIDQLIGQWHATLAGLGSPAQAATSHSLDGSVPSWANAGHRAGAAKSSEQVDFRVYLQWRGGDAAERYATAVSTPGTKEFHKFLTPAQFNTRYAPTTDSVNALKS